MELDFNEKLIVIAITAYNGSIDFSSPFVRYGLPCAILEELISRGHMNMNEDEVEPLHFEPIGDEVLDQALKALSHTRKKRKLSYWISKLSIRSARYLVKSLKKLEDDGIIKEQTGTLPGLFKRKRYRVWHETPVKTILLELHNTAVYGNIPSRKNLTLLSIIHGSKLTKRIFTNPEQRQIALQMVKKLVNDNPYYKAIIGLNRSHWISALTALAPLLAMLIKKSCS